MKIITVAATTSTNELAQQHLDSSFPYAVIAATQSAGVGQHGRHWQSPEGNIYLTLVCAPPTYKAPMTVVCASIVCDWLTQFGVYPTCKWANDILVQGKKLAGILCKGAMQGGKWQHLCIGIGLNVNFAPLPTSICMQDIDGIMRSPRQLAIDLAEYLAAALSRGEQGQRYTCAGAELWHDEQANYYLRSADDNYLCLKPLASDAQDKRLADSRGYHYAYQYPTTVPAITADVGNTRTKLTLFAANAKPVSFSAHNAAQLDRALRKLQSLVARRWVIYCVSVNADNYAKLQDTALAHGFVLSQLEGCYRYVGSYDYRQLGADRLAMIEACLAEYHDGQRTLIASFGTATTLDVLAADGKHEGGLIAAGAEISLQALYRATKLHPTPSQAQHQTRNAEYRQMSDQLGVDTATCIAHGKIQSLLALLERSQRVYQTECLLVSGGYATEIAAALPDTAIYDPILVARGVKAMVWRW
ncbi:MAG: biotin--[acetyl-CoA-carboxylase] ligase [Pseudomonadota bacterium]|nr:biotin--[acetyl-CoA-carboxylase] ligase [Pseudomonadota bacterium]